MVNRLTQRLLVVTGIVVAIGIISFIVTEAMTAGEIRPAMGWYVRHQLEHKPFLVPLVGLLVLLASSWFLVMSYSRRAYRAALQDGAIPPRDVDEIDSEALLRHVRAALVPMVTRVHTPVERVLDALFGSAVDLGATELRLIPTAAGADVVLRVGMDDFTVATAPKQLVSRVIEQLRLMVAVEQDDGEGQIDFRCGDVVDPIRVVFREEDDGTFIRIQVVGRSRPALPVERLGMPRAVLERFSEALHGQHGLILISAPTHQGVTTTLYAAAHHIHHLRPGTGLIASIEPHLQLPLPFMYQAEVGDRAPVAVLRSLLEKPYKVLVLRELHDAETAALAFEAAKSHLMLCSVGASTAAEALVRAGELVGGSAVADTLILSLGQRLVPRLCEACREPEALTKRQLERLAPFDFSGPAYRAAGCQRCRRREDAHTLPLFWIIDNTRWGAEALKQKASAEQLRQACERHQVDGLIEAALHQLRQGCITVATFIELLDEGRYW